MPVGDRIPTPKSEALKPMLWYLGVTLSPLAVASFSANTRVLDWMLVFAAAGVITFLVAYCWLLFMHPDRLQSEEYMTRSLLGDERRGPQAIVAKEAPVANTAAPPLATQDGRP